MTRLSGVDCSLFHAYNSLLKTVNTDFQIMQTINSAKLGPYNVFAIDITFVYTNIV